MEEIPGSRRVEVTQRKWTAVMREFYGKFTKDSNRRNHMRDVNVRKFLTDEVCDKCGAKMAIKFADSTILACTNYPNVRNA